MTLDLTERTDSRDWDLKPEPLDQSSDPVGMYLRQMGVVPLLTRQGELCLAKRIERGQWKVRKELSRSPMMMGEVNRLVEEVESGSRNLRGDDVTEEDIAERRNVFLQTCAELGRLQRELEQLRRKRDADSTSSTRRFASPTLFIF